MLTIDDEARDYLFILLDHIREHIPEGKCFRLVRAETGEAVLRLSEESDDDDFSEFEGRAVLVWNPEQFPDGDGYTLEVDEGDLEEPILVLAKAERTGVRSESVVELDQVVHRLLAETT
jgi:hypothetical protein